MLPQVSLSGNFTLAEVAKKVPRAIICLLSALRFHDIGTQSPSEVWIAVDRKAARPQVATPKLRVMRFSDLAFSSGVETHKIDGVTVRVYCPAKTVADCFKYRNKIGLDVAIEALRECRRSRTCKVSALERELIRRALESPGGNRAEAARRLGINRRLLYSKLEEPQIQ